jgi:hypothetical protein
LRDIDRSFNGSDEDRIDKNITVRLLLVFPSGMRRSQIFEWATFDAPENILDPPGWNGQETMDRITTQLAIEGL